MTSWKLGRLSPACGLLLLCAVVARSHDPTHLDPSLSFASPSLLHPLGCGEAGAVALFPAINNAVLDALSPLGVTRFEGPATPFHVWQAMQAAGGR